MDDAVRLRTQDRRTDPVKMKFVAGIHGNDRINTELLLQLIATLCENYGEDYTITKVSRAHFNRITLTYRHVNSNEEHVHKIQYLISLILYVFYLQLLNNMEVHFLPLINPDGASMALDRNCLSDKGQTNLIGVDLDTAFTGTLRNIL